MATAMMEEADKEQAQGHANAKSEAPLTGSNAAML